MTKAEKIERLMDFCAQHTCSDDDRHLECPHKENKYCTEYRLSDANSEDVINAWYYHFFGEDQEQQPDAVNHPSHYCDGGIETIDYIRAKMSREEFIGYCKGNALKYISRAGKKAENSLKQDLSKAITYLEWARDAAGAENEENQNNA